MTQLESLSRLAVLGAGKMGTTLIRSLLARKAIAAERIVASRRHEETLADVSDLGVATTVDNRQAVAGAEVILLCVKPQGVAEVLDEIGPQLDTDQLVISIVAGADTGLLEGHLPEGTPVVRTMPNTPSLIGAGMTAICTGRWASAGHLELAATIFDAMGRTTVLDESTFDAVTGLSASGPAFIYIVIEALAEGGVKAGLPRKVATELAAQTCFGAARMVLDTGSHPALLKDDVTTPAGCTMDGILELEAGGLRVTLIKAVVEATRRAGELVD